MSVAHVPDVVNESTRICRICLSNTDELYSILDFGKVCDKTVKISDMLAECTSIEVRYRHKFEDFSIHQRHFLSKMSVNY